MILGSNCLRRSSTAPISTDDAELKELLLRRAPAHDCGRLPFGKEFAELSSLEPREKGGTNAVRGPRLEIKQK